MSDPATSRSKHWRWGVCILLLFATTINYMDRVTLANTAMRVKQDLQITKNEQYGRIEEGFSYAFAGGSLLFGIVADRVNIRFLYPAVLVLWSIMGFASGLVKSFEGMLVCRTLLGLFEAGHWPCALKTIHRVLEPKERAMGNGILQSGASFGAVVTPLIIQEFLDRGLGWRMPYMVVGAFGAVWAVLWLVSIRSSDLAIPPPVDQPPKRELLEIVFGRRFLALLIMISLINATWQLLRAWLPLFLQEGRGYTEGVANRFTSAYYIATDLGVLTTGFIALRLVRRGMSVHGSRVAVFVGMSLLAMLTILAAALPKGLPLLATLLVVGFGTLGVFPCYYSFAQEVPARHVGKINGLLGACAWFVTGRIQKLFGAMVDRQHSYDFGVALAGCAPLLAIILFVLLWKRDPVERRVA